MIEEYLLIIDVSDFLRLQGGEGAPPLHDHRPFIDPESDNAAVLPPQPLPCLQLHQHQSVLDRKSCIEGKAVLFCIVWQTCKRTSMICFKTIDLFVKTKKNKF